MGRRFLQSEIDSIRKETGKRIKLINANFSNVFAQQTELHKGLYNSIIFKLMKEKKVDYIILDCSMEANLCQQFKYTIDNIETNINLDDIFKKLCEASGFPIDNIIYISANKFINTKYIKSIYMNGLLGSYDSFKNFESLTSINQEKRNKKYSFLNLKIRSQRMILFNQLYDLNLIDDGIVSYDSEKFFDHPQHVKFQKLIDGDLYQKYLLRKHKYILDSVATSDYRTGMAVLPEKVHKDCYFSIITETDFYSKTSLFITEKSFRPFDNYHMFVTLGNSGIIQEFENLGFDVFKDIINHSYDKELEGKIRYNLLLKEIQRLCNFTLDEWHEIYHACNDRLIFNKQHLNKYLIDKNIEYKKQLRDLIK